MFTSIQDHTLIFFYLPINCIVLSALKLPSISKSVPEHALSALVKYRSWQEERRLSKAFLSSKRFGLTASDA